MTGQVGLKRRVGTIKVADYVEVDLSPDPEKEQWVRWGSLSELERLINMAIVIAQSAAAEFGTKAVKARYQGLNPKLVLLTNPKFVLDLLNKDREYWRRTSNVASDAPFEGWQIPTHLENE